MNVVDIWKTKTIKRMKTISKTGKTSYLIKRIKKTWGKKWFQKIFVFLLAYSFLLVHIPVMTAQAYFNRGTVELSIGSDLAELEVGDTYTISVSISPDSYTGYPGCGLAKCPQECDLSCLLDGMCQCGGAILHTSNASLSISVANTAIASATFSSGVLFITGIRAGDTIITVQGTLKEYTNSAAQVIHVKVNKKSSSGSSSLGTESPTQGTLGENETAGQTVDSSNNVSNGNGQGGNITDTSVVSIVEAGTAAANTVAEGTAASAQQETQGQSVITVETQTSGVSETVTEAGGNVKQTLHTPNEGMVDIITLNTLAPTGKEDLTTAKERASSVTFQKLDSGKKVLYSWTFLGAEIGKPENFSMGIELSNEPRVMKSESGMLKNPLYLTFSHEGELPGKAKVYVSVGDRYQDGEKLLLYYLNQGRKTLELINDAIVVTGGYASFDMEHCSNYVLTTDYLSESSGGFSPLLIAGAVILVILVGGTGLIYLRCLKKITQKKEKSKSE